MRDAIADHLLNKRLPASSNFNCLSHRLIASMQEVKSELLISMQFSD